MTNKSRSARYSVRPCDAPGAGRHFWTPSEIVSEIQRRKGAGLRRNRVLIDDPSLVNAANNHFRSWRKAIEAAGFHYKTVCSRKGQGQKWDSASVIADIAARVSNNDDLAPAAMVRTAAYQAVYRLKLFSGWRQAVEVAGFAHILTIGTPYVMHAANRKRYPTPASVLQKVRELAAANIRLNPGSGSDPDSLQRRFPALYRAGKEHFGMWPKAVVSASVEYVTPEPYRSAHPVERTSLPRNCFSLDEPCGRDRSVPRMHFFGSNDRGYDTVEDRLTLEAIFDSRTLDLSGTTLLRRVIDGNDLENNEYELLAAMVRAKPELMELLAST